MLVLAFVMVACTERVVEAITGRGDPAGDRARRKPTPPAPTRTERQELTDDHCKRGHEFTDANTLIHHGRRECRACVVLRRRQVQRHG